MVMYGVIGKTLEKVEYGAYVQRPEACTYTPLPIPKKGKEARRMRCRSGGLGNRDGHGGKFRACSKRLGVRIFPPKSLG